MAFRLTKVSATSNQTHWLIFHTGPHLLGSDAVRFFFFFGLGLGLLLCQAFRLGFLRRDPIRLVRRLLRQPFLLGRCFRQGLGLRDARRVGFLLSELLQLTSCFGCLRLSLSLARSGFFGLPLGLLFGTSRFLRRFQSGGFPCCGFFGEAFGLLFSLGRLLGRLLGGSFPRCRLFGQACVEINQ